MSNSRFALLFALASLVTATARADTLSVGPGQTYETIQDALDDISPGDIVDVQGDHTYPGDLWFREDQAGEPGNPVTIRGVPVNGRRPIIEGVGTEEYHVMIVLLNASHFVFENFEIVGDGDEDHQGIVHKADDVVIRNVIVHGVGSHGLLGTDDDSGSLTIEASEFYDNGNGLYDHQIYMATDEEIYPGSVFRLQFCYIHDGAGGNNVKSRAERNEIYYNWIEAAVFHELDLIGPDGEDMDMAREDSDVVGNVLIKTSEWRIARIGGDGTGNTAGRYRFVNNTMVLGADSEIAIGMQETVQTLEMHNNVVIRLGAVGGQLVSHSERSGPEPKLFGSNNFIATGFSDIPESFAGTISGDVPGFTDIATFDLRPLMASPIAETGTGDTDIASPAFPSPLALPEWVPPARALGTHGPRVLDADIDIGAFEFGSGTTPGPGGGGGGGGGDGRTDSGCGCRAGAPTSGGGSLSLLVCALAFLRRRRR